MIKTNFSLALLLSLALLSCKKTRTCTCDINSTQTTTTVARNSGSTLVEEISSPSTKSEITFQKVKKKEIKRLVGCIDKMETRSYTFTTAVYSGTLAQISDITVKNVGNASCKIK